jgi:hypothetical protein
MKKNIAIALLLVVLSLNIIAFASAASVVRNGPTSAAPGQTFKVNYVTTGTTGNFVVAVEDSISGGCTPATKKLFLLSDDGSAQSSEVTYTAPQTGSCTFTGNYFFTGGVQTNMPNLIVTVSTTSPPVVCTTSQTQQCAATNGCTGTQTCSNNAWGTCTTNLQKCTDGTCATTCSGGTQPPADEEPFELPEELCKITSKLPSISFTDDACKDGAITLLGIIILLIVLIK